MLEFKYEIGMIVEDRELGTEYKIIDKFKIKKINGRDITDEEA